MALDWKTAFVEGGLGFAGNVIGNKLDMENQMKLLHETEAINLRQWEREARYSSPKEQMKRLKEAGLNPDLIYGNVSNATPDAQLTDGTPSAPRMGSAMSSTVSSAIQHAALSSEIQKNEAIAQNQVSESHEHEANTNFKNSTLSLEIDRLSKVIGLTEAQTFEAQQRGQMYQNQSNLLVQNLANAKQEFDLLGQQKQLNDMEIERMRIYTDQYGSMLQAQLDNLISETGLNDAHAAQLRAETKQIWATFNSIVSYWENMANKVAADEELSYAMNEYYQAQTNSLIAQLKYLPFQMSEHMFFATKYQQRDKEGNFVFDKDGLPVMRDGAAAFERSMGYVNEVANCVNTCADAVMKVGIGIGSAKVGIAPSSAAIPYRTQSGHQLRHQQTAKAYEDYLFETDPIKKGKKKEKFLNSYNRYEK